MNNLMVVVFIVVMFSQVVCVDFVKADTLVDNGIIYHESAANNVVSNILEDLMPLLDEEIVVILDENYDYILKSSNYSMPQNIFGYKVINKSIFIDKYRNIDFNDKYNVTRMFIDTIRDVIEIAMSIKGFDPNKDKLKKNIIEFNRNFNNERYVFDYNGHNSIPYLDSVDNIYKLKDISKRKIYINIVTCLSDLYNSQYSQFINKEVVTRDAYFVRRYPLINVGHKNIEDAYPSYKDCFDAESDWFMRNSKTKPSAVINAGLSLMLDHFGSRDYARDKCRPLKKKKNTGGD